MRHCETKSPRVLTSPGRRGGGKEGGAEEGVPKREDEHETLWDQEGTGAEMSDERRRRRPSAAERQRSLGVVAGGEASRRLAKSWERCGGASPSGQPERVDAVGWGETTPSSEPGHFGIYLAQGAAGRAFGRTSVPSTSMSTRKPMLRAQSRSATLRTAVLEPIGVGGKNCPPERSSERPSLRTLMCSALAAPEPDFKSERRLRSVGS